MPRVLGNVADRSGGCLVYARCVDVVVLVDKSVPESCTGSDLRRELGR